MPLSNTLVSQSKRFTDISSVFDTFFDEFEEAFPSNYKALIQTCHSLLRALYAIHGQSLSAEYKKIREASLTLLEKEQQNTMHSIKDRNNVSASIEDIMEASRFFLLLTREGQEKLEDREIFSHADMMLEYVFKKRDYYIAKKEEVGTISLLPSEEKNSEKLTRAYINTSKSDTMEKVLMIAQVETESGEGQIRGMEALEKIPYDVLSSIIDNKGGRKYFIKALKSTCITFSDMVLLSNSQMIECVRKKISPYYIAHREGNIALQKAIEDNHEDNFRAIDMLLINDCVEDNNSDLYKQFLAKHFDSEEHPGFRKYIENNFHLDVAVKNRSNKIIEFLLSVGVDINVVNKEYRTFLHFAAKEGHLETVELLLNKEANTEAKDACNRTPLHYAAKNGHIRIVELLLNKEANTEAKDACNRTPLHHAVERGYIKIVELLLSKGANIEAKSHIRNSFYSEVHDETPLHRAVERGYIKTVELLISKGANIEAKGIFNKTPLHYASENNHTEVVALLLSKGASIDAVDESGVTPLVLALKNVQITGAKYLIENGANVNGSWQTNTPLYHALRLQNQEISDLLIERGAKLCLIETIMYPTFSVESYLKPFLQRIKEDILNRIFTSSTIPLLCEQETSASTLDNEERMLPLNEGGLFSFVAHEEARRTNVSQQQGNQDSHSV